MNLILAALAGAGLISALDVFLALGWYGAESMFAPRLFAVFAGNALIALLFGWTFWRAKNGSAFALGFCLGLGPILERFGVDFPLALGASVVLAVISAWGLRRLTLPKLPVALVALATVAAPPFSLLALGISTERFEVEPAPELEARPGKADPTRPDVLCIVADTLRADTVLPEEIRRHSVHGDGLELPNLTRLRESGTWAEYANSPSNQTLPSHLSFMTVLDIEKVGMRHNRHRWPTKELLRDNFKFMSLANRFQKADYRTVGIASNPLLSQVDKEAGHQSFDDGFELWYGQKMIATWEPLNNWKKNYTWLGWLGQFYYETLKLVKGEVKTQKTLQHLTSQIMRRTFYPNPLRLWRSHSGEGERTTEAALRYLDTLVDGKDPYFMFLHYMDPHSPYIPAEPWRGSLAKAENRPKGVGADVTSEYQARVDLRHYLENKEDKKDWISPEAFGQWLHDLYREEVVQFDTYLGQILDRVEAGGRPTLIFFTSDHGELFGQHKLLEHGYSLYEGETAVPFLLAGPGIPENKKLAEPPELIDGAYTLLDLAGVNTDFADGRNVLEAETETARPVLTLMFNQAAVREGAWKFIYLLQYPKPEDNPPDKTAYQLKLMEVYQLDRDPGEQNNLLGDPETLEMAERLTVWLRERLKQDQLPHLPERKISARHQEKLDELGYAEGEGDHDRSP
ncbi:MAG: hypothetical protein DWQ01_15005 [Planctomycetota bacterium]|nr:MAG: hypothetical protein DWQ01_15005 [Planctomycetota bacterium]